LQRPALSAADSFCQRHVTGFAHLSRTACES